MSFLMPDPAPIIIQQPSAPLNEGGLGKTPEAPPVMGAPERTPGPRPSMRSRPSYLGTSAQANRQPRPTYGGGFGVSGQQGFGTKTLLGQ